MNILKKLKLLYVCEQGCEGRCKQCPQDIVNDAINYINRLRDELKDAHELVMHHGAHTLECCETVGGDCVCGFEEAAEKLARAVFDGGTQISKCICWMDVQSKDCPVHGGKHE